VGDAEPALTASELGRIVRGVDPGAFVVPARIVRRAIKHDRGLPAFTFRVPHRSSYVIDGEALLGIVERGELGLDEGEAIASTVLLIAEPEAEELAERPRAELIRETWRRLFHGRVHLALERKLADGSIDPAGLRERIRRLDPSAFEEARVILRQEDLLQEPRDDPGVYVEFAATYLELRAFAGTLIPGFFPAVRDFEAVDRTLAEDVDARALLASTRLPGSLEPLAAAARPTARPMPDPAPDAGPEAPSGARYRRLFDRAEKAASRGNLVRAAILRTEAARLAGHSQAGQARAAARKALDQLAVRLRSALGFDEADLRDWRKALPAPLERSARGTWTAEARLLFDLQKVCVDHERPFYTVGLAEWAFSLGRRPLKRLLPNHREVLMVQHLRGAARHLAAARLPEADRARFSRLVKDAVHRAEGRLRDRFRPAIARVLEETGFGARDLPERVALQKIDEELLDRVVERGFLAMGDFRDALSRNNRKLPDLAGPVEFLAGDRLLRADERLAVAMDGVYRRGEIYLRALQRLSALAFGTRTGRLLTRYLILPYGGTAVILKGLQEVAGPVSEWLIGSEMHLLNPLSLSIDGTVAIGLLYSKRFRQATRNYLGSAFHLVHLAVLGLPSWLIRLDWVRRAFGSRAFAFAWRAALVPSAVAWVAWSLRPRSSDPAWAASFSGLAFAVTGLLLTTRAGRDLEELAVDSVGRAWSWLISSLLPGLFRLIMETFDRVLEAIERVLYLVDEWLRFRGGQDSTTLGAKAVLGVAWGMVAYVVRFCVTILIEPQVNPIKHFPVVTVSHKIMLTQAFTLEAVMTGLLGTEWGLPIAGVVLLLIPGVFGFLVWELKENWRLYEANRPANLRPVAIGHHGETLARLLKPGFHSGTVPKLFAKLRKAERKSLATGRGKAVRKQMAHLHGVEESVRHFIDRDFLTLLLQSRSMGGTPLALGEISAGAKRFLIDLHRPGHAGPPLRLSFEEHSGWLVAGVVDPGWLGGLDAAGRNALATALAGLYKMAGVDLVRETIAEALGSDLPDFDFREGGIVAWSAPPTAAEVFYLLRPDPGAPPLISITPLAGPAALETPRVEPASLLFGESAVPWKGWVRVWEDDRAGENHPPEFLDGIRLLPDEPAPEDSGLPEKAGETR